MGSVSASAATSRVTGQQQKRRPQTRSAPLGLPCGGFGFGQMTTKKKNNKVAASVSSSSSTSIFTSATRTRRVQAHASDAGEFARLAADFTPGYSNASYYTTLGLYAMSLPGLYSIIKR